MTVSTSDNRAEDLHLAGETPANAFSLKFAKSANGSLELIRFDATDERETYWGRVFLDRIARVKSHVIKDSTLELYTNSDKLILQRR